MTVVARRILITGGSGFIGTNLVDHLQTGGFQLVNLDMAPPRKKEHLPYWKKTDLLDNEAVKQEVADFSPTHVVHLAARTDLDGRQANDYAVNTRGTANLIEALASAGTVERVIFASTMLVCRPGYIPENELDFAPSTVYGQSKIEMELMIRQKDLPFNWFIIRPTSIWGPWFQTPYKDFFDRVIEKKMYNIKKGSCTKTYGFVLNSVRQIEKLLFFKGTTDHKVFYIGDAPPLNINTWADSIASALGYRKTTAFPLWVFRVAALTGDLLKIAGVRFPMTSFRLKNMTTDNVLPLDNMNSIAGPAAYSMEQSVSITLDWIKHNK